MLCHEIEEDGRYIRPSGIFSLTTNKHAPRVRAIKIVHPSSGLFTTLEIRCTAPRVIGSLAKGNKKPVRRIDPVPALL